MHIRANFYRAHTCITFAYVLCICMYACVYGCAHTQNTRPQCFHAYRQTWVSMNMHTYTCQYEYAHIFLAHIQEEARKAQAAGLVGKTRKKDEENFSSIARSVAELGASTFIGEYRVSVVLRLCVILLLAQCATRV